MKNNINSAPLGDNGVPVPITAAKTIDNQGSTKVAETPKKRPVSARKREANRRNAKKSTGPRTARGKANVRFNALKHGLLATVVLLFANAEERPFFEQLLSRLWHSWRPVGHEEEACVEEIAICRWKKRRGLLWEFRQQREASRFEWAARQKTENLSSDWSPESREPSAVAGEPPEILIGNEMPAPDDLSLIIRYDAAADRQEHRAIAHLQKLQREREEKSTAASISTKEELNQ